MFGEGGEKLEEKLRLLPGVERSELCLLLQGRLMSQEVKTIIGTYLYLLTCTASNAGITHTNLRTVFIHRGE